MSRCVSSPGATTCGSAASAGKSPIAAVTAPIPSTAGHARRTDELCAGCLHPSTSSGFTTAEAGLRAGVRLAVAVGGCTATIASGEPPAAAQDRPVRQVAADARGPLVDVADHVEDAE